MSYQLILANLNDIVEPLAVFSMWVTLAYQPTGNIVVLRTTSNIFSRPRY